jgi:hypothetical protein
MTREESGNCSTISIAAGSCAADSSALTSTSRSHGMIFSSSTRTASSTAASCSPVSAAAVASLGASSAVVTGLVSTNVASARTMLAARSANDVDALLNGVALSVKLVARLATCASLRLLLAFRRSPDTRGTWGAVSVQLHQPTRLSVFSDTHLKYDMLCNSQETDAFKLGEFSAPQFGISITHSVRLALPPNATHTQCASNWHSTHHSIFLAFRRHSVLVGSAPKGGILSRPMRAP